jgi:predicted DNA-binding transcriptional regulator YafY
VALIAQADAPYAVDGRAALAKILDVLDPAARKRAEQLAGRVWVRTAPAERPAVLTGVEEGLAQRRVLVLRYRDRLGRPSHRRVEPHLLARTDGHWYLVGWCHTRRAPRWFRWDRTEAADLITERVPDRDPALFGTSPPDAHPVR